MIEIKVPNEFLYNNRSKYLYMQIFLIPGCILMGLLLSAFTEIPKESVKALIVISAAGVFAYLQGMKGAIKGREAFKIKNKEILGAFLARYVGFNDFTALLLFTSDKLMVANVGGTTFGIRKNVLEKVCKSHPEDIIKLNRRNFEIPHYEIQGVELGELPKYHIDQVPVEGSLKIYKKLPKKRQWGFGKCILAIFSLIFGAAFLFLSIFLILFPGPGPAVTLDQYYKICFGMLATGVILTALPIYSFWRKEKDWKEFRVIKGQRNCDKIISSVLQDKILD